MMSKLFKNNLLKKFLKEGGTIDEKTGKFKEETVTEDTESAKNESTEKEEKDKTESSSCSCTTVFQEITNSVTQAHFWHLNTDSYAVHKALNKYYDKMPDLMDLFLEAYMGMNGKMTGTPKGCDCKPSCSNEEMISYFEEVCMKMKEVRENELDNETLKSLLDDIIAQLSTTKYLLTLS